MNKDGDIAKEETQGKDEKGRTEEKKERENEKETEIDEFFKVHVIIIDIRMYCIVGR